MFFSRIRCSTTPASSAPGRVPMTSPSRALKPIVLSMLRPLLSAHILTPLPKWPTITRPAAISGAISGKILAIYSYDSP
jgi:hypothetical protein